MVRKKSQKRRKAYRKTGNKRGNRTGKRRNRQKGWFLNRYDFACARRDNVNQAGKIAPGIIKQATGEIDKIARNRIAQIKQSDLVEQRLKECFPKFYMEQSRMFTKHPLDCLGILEKGNLKK